MERDGEEVTIYQLDSLAGQKQFGSAHRKHHESDVLTVSAERTSEM